MVTLKAVPPLEGPLDTTGQGEDCDCPDRAPWNDPKTRRYAAPWNDPKTRRYAAVPDTDGMPEGPVEIHDDGASATWDNAGTEQAMRAIILRRIAAKARNHQRRPGPSQLGGCERRLGHHLAYGAPPSTEDPAKWRPTVGSFCHEGLTDWMRSDNRFLVDHKVTEPIAGTLDLFDTVTGTVVDWKVVGPTTLKHARAGRISDKHETQVDVYALGMQTGGYKVENVALWFMPSAGSLDDAIYYERPYNPARAWAAVARVNRIEGMLQVAEPAVVLAALTISDDFCASCPALGSHCDGFKGKPPAGSLGLTIGHAA